MPGLSKLHSRFYHSVVINSTSSTLSPLNLPVLEGGQNPGWAGKPKSQDMLNNLIFYCISSFIIKTFTVERILEGVPCTPTIQILAPPLYGLGCAIYLFMFSSLCSPSDYTYVTPGAFQNQVHTFSP